MTNPFRTGSKLGEIFEFMSDGLDHHLRDITEAAYRSVGVGDSPLFQRRVASALRTIRCLPGIDVEFESNVSGYQGKYKLVPARTEAAPGSRPAGDRS